MYHFKTNNQKIEKQLQFRTRNGWNRPSSLAPSTRYQSPLKRRSSLSTRTNLSMRANLQSRLWKCWMRWSPTPKPTLWWVLSRRFTYNATRLKDKSTDADCPDAIRNVNRKSWETPGFGRPNRFAMIYRTKNQAQTLHQWFRQAGWVPRFCRKTKSVGVQGYQGHQGSSIKEKSTRIASKIFHTSNQKWRPGGPTVGTKCCWKNIVESGLPGPSTNQRTNSSTKNIWVKHTLVTYQPVLRWFLVFLTHFLLAPDVFWRNH